MKNVFRLPLAALGLAALCAPVRLANAQPPCSGLSMTLADVAQKKWGRLIPDPADFKLWSDGGSNHTFMAPGAIQPIRPGEFYLMDNHQAILQLQLVNGSLIGPSRLNKSGANFLAMAYDGSNLYVLDGLQITVIPKSTSPGPGFQLGATPYDIAFDGQTLWVLVNDVGLALIRAVYDPSGIGKMTFTSKQIYRGPVGKSAKMASDGRYLWIAGADGAVYKTEGFNLVAQYKVGYTGDPQSLTFDGYSMWVTTAANTIHRFRVSDGTTLSNVTPGSVRGMAFDGTYMLLADKTNGQLAGYLACNAVPMLPYTVPASPEYVAFDGATYWVSSPLSRSVSIR